MSDTATVELSRDCGEEGTRRMTCKGKEDRDVILNEMTCIDEGDNINADNLISPSSNPLSDSHKKSMELIDSVATDNNEDNAIENHINQIEASAEKVIDKYGIDEMMLGDQAYVPEEHSGETVLEIKPTKTTKKLVTNDKMLKKNFKVMKNSKDDRKLNSDEFMMGDQPIDTFITLTTEKSIPMDTKSTIENKKQTKDEKTLTEPPSTAASTVTETTESWARSSTSITASTSVATPESRTRRETEEPTTVTVTDHDQLTTEQSINITKKSFNSLIKTPTEEKVLTHSKQEEAQTNDHFIPPMLLVRTKFTPTKPHLEQTTGSKASEQHQQTTTTAAEITSTIVSTTEKIATLRMETTSILPETLSTTTIEPSTAKVVSEDFLKVVTDQSTEQIKETVLTTIQPEEPSTASSTTAAPTSENVITTIVPTHAEHPHFRQPHAPKHSPEIHAAVETVVSTTAPSITTYASSSTEGPVLTEKPTETSLLTVVTSNKTTTETQKEEQLEVSSTISVQSTTEAKDELTTQISNESTTKQQEGGISKLTPVTTAVFVLSTVSQQDSSSTISSGTEDSHDHEFYNTENLEPPRPNRRRELTKPETHSYIKKLFG